MVHICSMQCTIQHHFEEDEGIGRELEKLEKEKCRMNFFNLKGFFSSTGQLKRESRLYVWDPVPSAIMMFAPVSWLCLSTSCMEGCILLQYFQSSWDMSWYKSCVAALTWH